MHWQPNSRKITFKCRIQKRNPLASCNVVFSSQGLQSTVFKRVSFSTFLSTDAIVKRVKQCAATFGRSPPARVWMTSVDAAADERRLFGTHSACFATLVLVEIEMTTQVRVSLTINKHIPTLAGYRLH